METLLFLVAYSYVESVFTLVAFLFVSRVTDHA